MKTLVLGIGNTILGDDGAGVQVVRLASLQYPDAQEVTFRETGAAGLNLLDLILGCERLIVVDAILTEEGRAGRVFRLDPQQLDTSAGAVSLHSCGLAAALELAEKSFPGRAPREVSVIAVGIRAVDTVCESLSPEVEKALPEAVNLLLDEIAAVPPDVSSLP